MKYVAAVLAFLLCSCGSNQPSPDSLAQDEADIKTIVNNLHISLSRAYNKGGIDTDSLMDAYYDKDMYYVTPWATSEPLDSTKKRLRSALALIKDYSNSVESLNARSYGNCAFAFFVLRQNYVIDGHPRDEYLPTTLIFERQGDVWQIVHAQRTTDYETMQQYVQHQKDIEGKK